MSKVLVDREHAEVEGVEVAGYRWKTAIPEATGGGYGWSYASHWSTGPKDAEKLMTIADHLAALSAVTAERDMLESMLIRTTTRHFAQQWKDRADDKKLDECLSEGIAMLEAERDQLRAEVEALRKDAVRWRYVRLQGDDTHWLNLLRVDLDEFGGNINAAVDALIDGEAPAMAAKEA